MFKKSAFVLLALWIISRSLSSHAGDQVGTLTQIDGAVKLFTHPTKSAPQSSANAHHALFEGQYFEIQDAKIGDAVEKGNVLRTAPGGKARVVFPNGDQYNVGSATAYKVTWNKDDATASTDVNLMYGKIRGIVEKGGPRSHLTIRTKTATMGVRGTDFFIADAGTKGTEVSILRGAVEVKSEAPKAKPIEVKAGYSAEVIPAAEAAPTGKTESTATNATTPAPVAEAKVELRKTTKEDLAGIQKSSSVQKSAPADTAPEVATKVNALEQKAVTMALNDIQKTDPKLYSKIDSKSITTPEEINTRAVENISVTAPKAPEKRKPYKSELDDLEQGAYEKYFKPVQ